MRKWIAITLALASVTSLAACGTPQGDRAVTGAALGGAAGAIIGGAATGKAGGALAGAAIGAAGGAMIGAATTPKRCARYAYDYYGNPVCTAYYR